jgi:hypothetical protein
MAAGPKSLTAPAVLARLYVTTGRIDEAKKICILEEFCGTRR